MVKTSCWSLVVFFPDTFNPNTFSPPGLVLFAGYIRLLFTNSSIKHFWWINCRWKFCVIQLKTLYSRLDYTQFKIHKVSQLCVFTWTTRHWKSATLQKWWKTGMLSVKNNRIELPRIVPVTSRCMQEENKSLEVFQSVRVGNIQSLENTGKKQNCFFDDSSFKCSKIYSCSCCDCLGKKSCWLGTTSTYLHSDQPCPTW